MKILFSWLKDYVQTDLPAQKAAELLSDAGFPCEGIEYQRPHVFLGYGSVEIDQYQGALEIIHVCLLESWVRIES